MNRVTFRRLACAAWVAVAYASACGKESSSDACTRGEEGCVCYPNGTCNAGLECLSSLCVSRTGSGGVASVAQGGSNESGAGASSETAGAGAETSSAGAPPVEGGSDGGGAGGARATGGASTRGGADAGGTDTAGRASGGTFAAGAASGGAASGGAASGGAASGGAASGGAAGAGGKGGAGSGGAQGGKGGAAGGGGTGGAGGAVTQGGTGGSCAGVGGATLFFDTFECGTQLWTPQVAGSFALVVDGSNTYQRSALAASLALTSAGSLAWRNVLIEAKVKALSFGAASSASYVAIYGRFVDANNYHAVAWQGDGTVAVRHRENGAGSDAYNRDTLLTTGEWYTLGLELSGVTTRILVNGSPISTTIGSTVTSGRIALSTFNASARFDEVRVTQLP